MLSTCIFLPMSTLMWKCVHECVCVKTVLLPVHYNHAHCMISIGGFFSSCTTLQSLSVSLHKYKSYIVCGGYNQNMHILPPVASAPTNLMAVQEGLTSVRVSWSPPTPLGDTTGYRIYYSGGSSGSVDVSDGSTDSYLLTGLQNGESYTISIVATSQHLPSESVVADMEVMLGEYIHVRSEWRHLQHICIYITAKK